MALEEPQPPGRGVRPDRLQDPVAVASRPLRILLQIVQFPPDVNSTGLLMAKVGEDLVAAGHEVDVITALPHYRAFRIEDRYRGKLVERETYRGMNVLRLWVYASGRKTMPRRLFNYLSFNLGAALAHAFRRRRYDVVLCTNGSFFTGVSAVAGRRFRPTPFVYNVQDLYPEVGVRTGQLRNRAAIRMLEAVERFMYRKAAHISVITPSFAEHVAAAGIARDKISVIPNFVDTDFIKPLDKKNPFSDKHGLAEKFVVTHAGNVGHVYDLDSMLDAAKILEAEDDVLLLIIGDGVTKEDLQRRAADLRLGNVMFLPFQPFEQVPLLRAASDIQVSLYKRGSARSSMPSKIYEIMASGRPVLLSAEPETDVRRFVERTGCGVCLDPEDPVAIADAILRLKRDDALRRRLGEVGRRAAEAGYSRQAVFSAYNRLLQEVTAGASRGPRTSYRIGDGA